MDWIITMFFYDPMSLEAVNSLYKLRKWYNCAEEMKKMISKGCDNKTKNTLLEIYEKTLKFLHPITIADLTLNIISLKKLDECPETISRAIEVVQSKNTVLHKYDCEKICLEMSLCRIYAELGVKKDIERNVIQWKEIYEKGKLSSGVKYGGEDNNSLFFYVSYIVYRQLGNIFKSQKYLMLYIKYNLRSGKDVRTSSDKKVIENCKSKISILVELSIASEDYYNFAQLAEVPGFDENTPESLKNILKFFEMEKIEMNDTISKGFRDIARKFADREKEEELYSQMVEKIYLMGIVNMCFRSNEKAIPFTKIAAVVNMEEKKIVRLLLKVLGKGLVSGWIDTKEKMFVFYSVVPRHLSSEDIDNMKEKYVQWKAKVGKVADYIDGMLDNNNMYC